MKSIIREMYEMLVRLHQSPYTRHPERDNIEKLLDRVTDELVDLELADNRKDKFVAPSYNVQASNPIIEPGSVSVVKIPSNIEELIDQGKLQLSMGCRAKVDEKGVIKVANTGVANGYGIAYTTTAGYPPAVSNSAGYPPAISNSVPNPPESPKDPPCETVKE